MKIIDCNYDEISNHFKLIFFKIGLRAESFPNKIEKELLINFLYENYPNFKISEINLAFDLAIKGVTEAKVEHYENFSVKYLASIINGYIPWATQNIEKLPKKDMLQIEDKKELSQVEIEEWIVKVKEKFLQNDYAFDLLPIIFYDYLDAKKIFLTQQKKEVFQLAIKKRLLDLNLQINKSLSKFEISEAKIKVDYLIGDELDKSNPEYKKLSNIGKRLLIVEYFNK